ncbi:MAG TPA: Fe-S-containing protein, partial [Bacteroidota bacterium]|nr:Fe-S-containing protein [Bacteroidota bacterium]
AGAVILEQLAMDFEMLEGYLMFVAAVFVTIMVVWMWRTARHIKKAIEQRVDVLVSEEKNSWNVSLGVFLFTFLMVVREGIETVIFLRAVSSGQGCWGGSIGVLIGIAGATLFGFFFVKGSVRVDIGRFLKVTAVVLMIFVLQLIVNGAHEFYELGVFPASPHMMQILGPIVRNNLLFVLAIVSIPAIIFVIPGKKNARAVVSRSNRRWQLAMGIISLCVIFFLGFDDIYSKQSSVRITPAVNVKAENGTIRIPVGELIDGELHRFLWITGDGVRIRFFALRNGLSTYSTAFDACRACYNYGYYYMKERELICSVCEAPSQLSKLAVATEVAEEQGGSMEGMGCAPIYLPSRMTGEFVTVKVGDLEERKKFFQTSHVELDYTVIPVKKEK